MNIAPYSTAQPDPPICITIFQIRLGFGWAYGLCGILFPLLSFVGCNGSDTSMVSHGGPVQDHVSLVDTLRGQGLTVEPTGPVSQPFFPISGQIRKVNGKEIEVSEFDDAVTTESQTNEISSDRTSIGTTKIQWIGHPTFSQMGKSLCCMSEPTDFYFANWSWP